MNYTTKFYDNCEIYCPGNILLGYCNFDKFNWYLEKELAIKITSKSLKLKFIPNNWNDTSINSVKKENICVNCSIKEDLTKHHIIPKCYLKHFPLELKNNNSHDVVLMCGDCHSSYEQHATLIKKELAVKYNAPLDTKKDHIKLFKAYSCLVQLMNLQLQEDWNKNEMILNMMHTVERYLPTVSYSYNDVTYLKRKVTEAKMISHGKIIIKNISDYQRFAEMWRKHFIDTMDPAFMSSDWNSKKKLI